MGITFTRSGRLISVSEEEPLPVILPTEVLLIQTTNLQNATFVDLKGSTNSEEPTLIDCSKYRQLLWTFHTSGNATIDVRILSRVTDNSGQPLGAGWFDLTSLQIDVLENSYFRVNIPETTFDAYYDQYRIEVRLLIGDPFVIKSKIVGVL